MEEEPEESQESVLEELDVLKEEEKEDVSAKLDVLKNTSDSVEEDAIDSEYAE